MELRIKHSHHADNDKYLHFNQNTFFLNLIFKLKSSTFHNLFLLNRQFALSASDNEIKIQRRKVQTKSLVKRVDIQPRMWVCWPGTTSTWP